jgi:hypothetical protein
MLDPAKDYIVKMPSTPLDTLGGLIISGGRNVVLKGGEIRFSRWYTSASGATGDRGKDNRALYITGTSSQTQARTVFIEGLLVGGYLGEGVNIDMKGETRATVVFQNVRVDSPIVGSQASNHADLIQAWNGPDRLYVDRMTATGLTYQGLFLQPMQFGTKLPSLYDFRNMNLVGTDTSGYLYWKSDPWVQNMQNLWAVPNPSKAANRGQWLWSASDWSPVKVGSPPGGDFVPAGRAGIGYVSPGYLP